MNIAVLARPVHNQAFPVRPGDVRHMEELEGYSPVPNPYDEYALEYALKLKDQCTASITALGVGGAACERVLREFYACGADRAVLIEETEWEPDGMVAARRIAEYLVGRPFHLGLFGFTDTDTLSGQMGPMVAALARLPFVGPVVDLRRDADDVLLVCRRTKRATERLRVPLPVCLGIQRGEPLRYSCFWRRVQAERMDIERVTPSVALTPRVRRVRFTNPKPQRTSSRTGERTQETIYKALGISKAGERTSSLIVGTPQEQAGRALELMSREKIICR